VRRLARKGARVIKISLEDGPGYWPLLSRAQVRAIVAEAHARRLLVTAHVGDVRAARLALETGVDELVHMPCGGPDRSLMRELARRSVEIVGTLHVLQPHCGEEARTNARAFVEAGGVLLYGSDYGNPGIPAGVDVAELRLMVSAGLTPLRALVNATSRAARQLPVNGVGMLRVGARADVVAVRGDPFTSFDVLAQPALVLVRGVVVVDGPRLNLPPPP
jgi:imidazolonepropionase-like amidohydrolase